jgi:hypothetical protein
MIESLRVYRYSSPSPRYLAIYDFQWKTTDGEPQGHRVEVSPATRQLSHNINDECDVFRKILPFGTIALRCIGQDHQLRAEYRLGDGRNGDNAYVLPVIDGDELWTPDGPSCLVFG